MTENLPQVFLVGNENAAMNSMRLFSEVCKLVVNISNVILSDPDYENKKTEIIEDFKSNIPEIMKISKPNISDPGTINRNFQEFLQDYFSDDISQGAAVTTVNPCIQDLSKINVSWALAVQKKLENPQNQCYKKVAEKANLLFDFRFVEHPDYLEQKNDFETLKQALPNHIVLIFAAFGGLRSLSSNCKDKIIECFTEEVMKEPQREEEMRKYVSFGQGWGGYKKETRSRKTAIKKDELLSAIKEQIIIFDSIDRYFCPKPEEGMASAGADTITKHKSDGAGARNIGGR